MLEFLRILAGVQVSRLLVGHGLTLLQAGKNKFLEFAPIFSQFGQEKEQRHTSPKNSCELDDLQASNEGEIYEYGEFKGKDRHDSDGSLSLGLGEASGRVDVPVSVGVLLHSEKVFRSSQSVAVVTPGSCVVKTICVKGVDGSTRVHRVKGHTEVRELLDCTDDAWVTYKGKKMEIAAAEAQVPPDPPQGPAPDVQATVPPPRAEEEEVDQEMDNEGSEVPGSGVGDFMTPSRKKVIKSSFVKGASIRKAQCARSGALE